MNDMYRLRGMLVDNPSVPAVEVVARWADGIRGDELRRLQEARSTQEGIRIQNEQEYRYALTKPIHAVQTHLGEFAGSIVTEADSRRFSESELRQFAKEEKLEYDKLRSVAVGERKQYKGWFQGEFLRSTFGRPYSGLPEPESEPVKVGAWDFLRR